MKNKKILLAFLPAFLLASCGATSDASHYVGGSNSVTNKLVTSKSDLRKVISGLESATVIKKGKEISTDLLDDYYYLVASISSPVEGYGLDFKKSKVNKETNTLDLTFNFHSSNKEDLPAEDAEVKESHTFVIPYKKGELDNLSAASLTINWEKQAYKTAKISL